MDKQLEIYLQTLEKQLRFLPPQRRKEELREMQSHLQALIGSYIERGKEDDAVGAALKQFGPPRTVARALRRVEERQAEKSLQLVVAMAALLVCCSTGYYFWLAGIALTTVFIFPDAPMPNELAPAFNLFFGVWFLLVAFASGAVAGFMAPRRGMWGATGFYGLVSAVVIGHGMAQQQEIFCWITLSVPIVFLGALIGSSWKRRNVKITLVSFATTKTDSNLLHFIKPRHKSNLRRSGFTLVELLIVIAIIATLTALLFPIFSHVKEKARRATCQSNLKQMMTGVEQYAQDYGGKYPSLIQVFQSRADHPWYQLLQPYLKSVEVTRCPDDDFIQRESSSVPHTSYNANSFISLVDDAVSQAQVTRPATTVYLADAGVQSGTSAPYVMANSTVRNGCWMLGDPGDPLVQSPGTTWCGPILRHDDMSNVAFLDGHAKALKAEKWYFLNTPWLDPARGGS